MRSLLEVQLQLKEFLRCESLRIIREIVEKAVDQKLLVIDFLVRAFALSGDVEVHNLSRIFIDAKRRKVHFIMYK